MDRFKGVLFTIIGVVMLVVCCVVTLNTRAFVRTAAVANGVVSKLNAGGSHPEIDFVTAKGERISYPQGGEIGGYKVGDRVRVLYDPAQPAMTATLDVFGAVWDWSTATAFFGVVFTTVGIALLRGGKR